MTGATATAIGIGVATSVVGAGVSTGISALAGGGGGGGGPVSSQSGGGGGLNVTQSQYAYYGPHPSTSPLQGKQAPNPQTMQAPKAGVAAVASANHTPTQGAAQNAQSAKGDFNNMWADRLSKYLDYNTRTLG